MTTIDYQKLFNPRAVGIVGVNEKPYGGGYFLKCLKETGFDKPLFLINPRFKGRELDGIKVLGSISEIPDDQPVDYVILAVPAKSCAPILEEIGKKSVPFITIFTSGFSEIDNYELEEDILKVANRYNMRIIGPNCLGVYNPKSRLSISRWQTTEAGNLALISQSGNLSIILSNMAIHSYGTYISKVISIGNQIDLNVVDFLKYFLIDNDTKVVGLYLENIKNQKIGKEFIKIVKDLSLKGKPVMLWKVGYGESARETILSHTGGMAGSIAIWRAISKQIGAIFVHNSEELVNLAMGFNYLDIKQINRNVGIVAIGGGPSIEITEQMEMYNLKVPKLNLTTKEKLREFLPDVNTIIRNPLDLGGSGLSTDIFVKSLVTLDSDPNVSIVLFIKPYYFTEEFTNGIIKAKTEMKKPLICIANKVIDDIDDYKKKLKFKKELFKNKIPVFESIENTAKSIQKICLYKEFLERQRAYQNNNK